jgi:hypothetical protein
MKPTTYKQLPIKPKGEAYQLLIADLKNMA